MRKENAQIECIHRCVVSLASEAIKTKPLRLLSDEMRKMKNSFEETTNGEQQNMRCPHRK